MQDVERPWGVLAPGWATVHGEPDVVRLRFAVARTAAEPEPALQAAGSAVAAARGVLRGHRIEDRAVLGSRLSLQTLWNHTPTGRLADGYEGRATFALESSDLDDVPGLLTDLVAAAAAEVDQVDYGLSEARAAMLRAQARRRAVAEARSTAQLYAEAAGIGLGAVLHLEEAAPGGGGVRGVGFASAQTVSLAMGAADLGPGAIGVTAGVVMGFAITAD